MLRELTDFMRGPIVILGRMSKSGDIREFWPPFELQELTQIPGWLDPVVTPGYFNPTSVFPVISCQL